MRFLGLVFAFLFSVAAHAEVTVTDGYGNEVVITDTSRIVALGGDVTEIIYALGEGDRIIASDTTSLYPEEAQSHPKVGYVRNVAAEGLLSLGPTLIIANSEAGPPAALEQIEAIGIPVLRLGSDESAGSIAFKVRTIGAALELEDEAEALASTIEAQLAEVSATDVAEEDRPGVIFVLNASSGAPMAAGSGTRADTMIRLAGGRNLFAEFDGYRPLSPEAAVESAPDAIIMMDHTFYSIGGLEGLRAHPALGLTPAAREGRVIAMDGLLLLGFGPRTPAAIAEVREGLEAAPGIN